MYVLYLDESGNESNTADKYFVLAGVAAFERQIHYLGESVDAIQARHLPIAMHASPMKTGKGFWRKVEKGVRETMLAEMAQVIARSERKRVVLFAVAVRKQPGFQGEAIVQSAVEEICGRFNRFLHRLHKQDDTQRGLLVFAEGRFDQRAKSWIRTFRRDGTRIGAIRNFAEDLPYFASAEESRMLQLADYVSHAVFRKVERDDPSLLDPIMDSFDRFPDDRCVGLVIR